MAGTFPIHLATGNITLLQCACSSGTSVQSQSLGHANGAVASCSLLFVAPPHQPKNWEEGITPMNCFPLFKHDVEWMGTVEHPQVWEDGHHGIWHCRCNIKCGGRLFCFLYALHRTRKNLVVLSAQGKRSDF